MDEADLWGGLPVSGTDEPTIDIARQVAQRLESLRRAGLDRLPKPPAIASAPLPRTVSPPAPEPRPEPVPPAIAPPPMPEPIRRPVATKPSAPSVLSGSLFDEPEPGLGPVIAPD